MISYIGGKGRIGNWIVPHIPKDIETYVEPFGGMFWVFFRMNLIDFPNLKTVVYNDFNKLNSNLFKCVKHYDMLYEELKKYPCQQEGEENTPPIYKQMFNEYQKEIFAPDFKFGDDPNFEIAAKYVYVLTQVFSGSRPETSPFTDYKGKYKCKVITFMEKLKKPKYQEHFDKITFVENLDFADVMQKYDSPTTYFYLDPPYWKTEDYYSNHDFNAEDHRRLADMLHSILGKFSLSYYDFSSLSNWLPKDKYVWTQQDFKKAASAKKDGTQNVGTELLIMNYNPPIIDAVKLLSDMPTEEIKNVGANNVLENLEELTDIEYVQKNLLESLHKTHLRNNNDDTEISADVTNETKSAKEILIELEKTDPPKPITKEELDVHLEKSKKLIDILENTVKSKEENITGTISYGTSGTSGHSGDSGIIDDKIDDLTTTVFDLLFGYHVLCNNDEHRKSIIKMALKSIIIEYKKTI